MSLAGFQVADIFTWQVGVWVLIILVTGFIGQFGKSFAKYVINHFNRKKNLEAAPSVSVSSEKHFSQPASPESLPINNAKTQKKEAKALLKAKKKEAKQGKKG
jgi:hypothetical protein